ncbi:MAG: sugar ABC transporter permease [Clostridia bacterium]|nr:sugar ABC transporter permease [Clostridia bacterium]MDY5555069.1 sugar ABC transporter permease [Blautia sp.]
MKKKKILRAASPYIWLLPSILLMVVFILFPIFEVFRTSFSDVSKAGIVRGFAGFDNFAKVLKSSSFAMVLKNTLIWTVVVVGLSTVIGIVLAMVLNNEFRGRKLVRAIVVFPWATSLIIQASVWKFIIDGDYGTLNTLLMKLGIINKAVNWTPTPAAYFAWECWVGIFVTVPFVTFCVLSGLQSIDSVYYEAATVDGAGFWQKMFNVTLPLLRSSLTVSTVLNIIYVFNSFPIVWTITKGDPANRTDTLVTYLYKQAFYKGRTGEAAAISVIGFLILCVCASVYMVLSLRKEDQDA